MISDIKKYLQKIIETFFVVVFGGNPKSVSDIKRQRRRDNIPTTHNSLNHSRRKIEKKSKKYTRERERA